MKKLSIFAALVIASIGAAHADVTLQDEANTMKATIHSATVAYGYNEQKNVQVDSWVSIQDKAGITRMQFAVTGCDKQAGRIVQLDEDTSYAVGRQYVWVANGPSMMDNVAESICSQALIKANKELAYMKASKKTGI